MPRTCPNLLKFAHFVYIYRTVTRYEFRLIYRLVKILRLILVVFCCAVELCNLFFVCGLKLRKKDTRNVISFYELLFTVKSSICLAMLFTTRSINIERIYWSKISKSMTIFFLTICRKTNFTLIADVALYRDFSEICEVEG